MENLLPFEKIKREIIIRKRDKINEAYGNYQDKRPIEEVIQYGIVNIDKPQGPTSHQVSDYVQKILGISKSGHSGTLDPNVTGVLPVALGRATRIVQCLLTAGKEYVALMHLHKEIPENNIRECMRNFTGKIKQLPPIKSSVKRVLRQREIYYIDILEIDGKEVLFKVGCEAGTYIRKLCLHSNTNILAENGFIPIKDFYLNPQKIYSLKDAKIIKKTPSAIQKLNSPKKLIKLMMDSGVEIVVTEDHKLLASFKDGYKMVETQNLRRGDYLVKKLKIPWHNKEIIISDLLDDNYLIAQPEIKAKCKVAFIKKYGSIREMNRKIRLDRKSFLTKSNNAIPLGHLKLAGIYEDIKKQIYTFKTNKGSIIKLKKLTTEHFYLLGLLASDGNNTREKGTQRYTRLKFHNKEKALVNKFLEIYKRLFPNIPISKKIVHHRLFQLDTSNSLFATIAASLGVRSPHKDADLLPILNCSPYLIKSFLRGYFDGDGTAYFKKKSNIKGHYSNIRIYCSNYINIKRIHKMLLKIGISNKIIVSKSFKLDTIYIVDIDNLASKKRFIREIGSNHPHKKYYLEQIANLKAKKINDYHYIGFQFKEIIKKQKRKLYKMGGNLNRALGSKIPITKGFYNKCSKLMKLPSLDNFIIERITDVTEVRGVDYVYDMTVPVTHNFLIETGFVSSNCHDMGVKLKTGAHMAELRRTKAGPFDEATLTTLTDLNDAYHFWKEEHDESHLRKIIQPVENAVRHLPKVWVFDSAVEPLCHGSDLKLPGIYKFESGINKDDTVAVMTSKDELVCLGNALLTSDEMLGEKGVAVKTEKVFMVAGSYSNKNKKI